MSRLFVNDLMVMDFSYLDERRGLLGESWKVDLELAGTLDSQGMLLDFGAVKPLVRETIDAEFDHRLLVPADHPGLRLEREADSILVALPLQGGGEVLHRGPESAVTLISARHIEPETVAASIVARLRALLPANISAVELRLAAESISGACYQYSHGLKRHDGNCQRIAHGHRSRLEIARNGRRDAGLEAVWADHWRDIYIGSRADLVATEQVDGQPHLRFSYRASQGAFELRLPERLCYLIDSDSTVEHIAQHIATCLAARHPGDHIRVRAFEGIGKGAVAECRQPRDSG